MWAVATGRVWQEANRKPFARISARFRSGPDPLTGKFTDWTEQGLAIERTRLATGDATVSPDLLAPAR